MKSYIDDEKKPFTGKFIEKGWNGELISEQNFVDGILEGDYIEYDTRGDETYISVQGKYKNGTKIGEHISWWRPNHKKRVSFYDENGELHGEMIIYEGYSVEEPSTIQNYNHGKKDGISKWFYRGGQLKSSEIYKNGKQDGLESEFYENGNKRIEVNYVNDKKDGLYTQWYENGQVRLTVEYKSGKKNGAEIYYFENGKKEKEGEYLDNSKKGRFVWYKKDGTIAEETTY
jgi:antitoxin component YwqK of YwqJK toxin-antitoxin module